MRVNEKLQNTQTVSLCNVMCAILFVCSLNLSSLIDHLSSSFPITKLIIILNQMKNRLSTKPCKNQSNLFVKTQLQKEIRTTSNSFVLGTLSTHSYKYW